jgi:hypothetical protein
MRARPTILCLASAMALVTGGCSFKLVKRPPHPSEWPPADRPPPRSSAQTCGESMLPPTLDTVSAVVVGTLALLERKSGTPITAVVLGLMTIPFGASAVYGYGVSSKCRQYHDRFTPGQ